MRLKTVASIAIIIIIETYCLYPILGSMINIGLNYTIFISLLVAAVFCIFAYAGSYLGIGQLFVIPDLPEIKKDKIKAWAIFAITIVGVFAIQGSLCFLLYKLMTELKSDNIARYYLPMVLEVIPTFVSLLCGIPTAEANKHRKYSEEMYIREMFRKRGIKDGHGEPFKQGDQQGLYYTDFINIQMKEFDKNMQKDWKEKYIPKLSELNIDIDSRNHEGAMFRENAILTLGIMSKNLKAVVDENHAQATRYEIGKYLNDTNGTIRTKNTEGNKKECEARELKVLYSVVFSETQAKYLARLTIYWDILLNTYKKKMNKEYDVRNIGQLPNPKDLMRICSIKDVSVDYTINKYVNIDNILYNHD